MTAADKARRETVAPSHNMDKIDEENDEEKEIKEEDENEEDGEKEQGP